MIDCYQHISSASNQLKSTINNWDSGQYCPCQKGREEYKFSLAEFYHVTEKKRKEIQLAIDILLKVKFRNKISKRKFKWTSGLY